MKKTLSKLVLAATMVPAVSFGATVEERLAELEANQSLNIFKFSGTLETYYDSITAKQTTDLNPTVGGDQGIDGKVDYLRLRASLNVDADVSDKIKFYSRFTTSKFFNTYLTTVSGQGTAPVVSSEFDESRSENGSTVYLEKAYADVTASEGLVFSFGRLPTMDGPLTHIPSGRARSGTYPSLMYNASLDGFAASYNLGGLSARVIYTPQTVYANNSGKNFGSGLLEKPLIGSQKTNPMMDLTSAMVEYSTGDVGFASNIGVIYQGYLTGDIAVGGDMIDLNPTAGTGSGRVSSVISAHSLTVTADNVARLPLTFGLTYLASEVKNEGEITTDVGSKIYGLGAKAKGETLRGNSTLVSARYDVTSRWMVGAEYLAGGKNVFIYDVGADNLTGFYSTPGTGTHAYVLHKLTPELGLRVGVTHQEYKTSPFNFGESKTIDRKIDTTYANLRLDF